MVNMTEDRKSKYNWIIDAGILFAIAIITMLLRIIPQQETVFGAGWINFQGNDSWYHLRLIENLLHHFPIRIMFDPYTFYPYGQEVFFAPFYDILIGFFAWIIGLGAPTQHTIEMVAAYGPPILGTLTVIPAYFIGKALFNRKVGLLTALLIGILPSMFIVISSLASLDHHVAEVLFSTTAIAFLLLALKSLRANLVSFSSFKSPDRQIVVKPLVYAALCGVTLGLYLLTWVGGLLFIFLIFCYFVLMFVIDYLRHQNTDYHTLLSIPVFLIPLIIIAPFPNQLAYYELEVLSLAAGVITVPVLLGISKLSEIGHLKRYLFPIVLIVFTGIVSLGAYLVSPSVVETAISKFSIFNPNTYALTIAEVQPFFLLNGEFSFTRFWSYFNISGIFAIIAFIVLLVNTIRKTTPELILLLIWSLLIFLAVVGQSRFTIYLTVNIAVLSAYLTWLIIDTIPIIWKRLKHKSKKSAGASKKRKIQLEQITKPDGKGYKSIYYSLVIVVIGLLTILPNIKPAINMAKTDIGMNRYWHDALTWMRENTPDPFDNLGYYYEIYDTSGANYPDSAYGILSWWPYGHMITEVAHRIPNSNPHQSGAWSAAHFLINEDEEFTKRLIERNGAKYIIIDLSMAFPYNNILMRFTNIAFWAEKDISDFTEIYYIQNGNTWQGVILYYPEYYYNIMTRLYNFDGEEVIPDNTSTVISYQDISGRKVIQSSQLFSTYEEAMEFIENQPAGNYRLVGQSPLMSPVPLAKLEYYERVYESDSVPIFDTEISYLKIFEYIP